jgi:hypothetical protein
MFSSKSEHWYLLPTTITPWPWMFFGGKNSPISPFGEISQSREIVVFFEFFSHKKFQEKSK